jgi:hypothetical protein
VARGSAHQLSFDAYPVPSGKLIFFVIYLRGHHTDYSASHLFQLSALLGQPTFLSPMLLKMLDQFPVPRDSTYN